MLCSNEAGLWGTTAGIDRSVPSWEGAVDRRAFDEGLRRSREQAVVVIVWARAQRLAELGATFKSRKRLGLARSSCGGARISTPQDAKVLRDPHRVRWHEVVAAFSASRRPIRCWGIDGRDGPGRIDDPGVRLSRRTGGQRRRETSIGGGGSACIRTSSRRYLAGVSGPRPSEWPVRIEPTGATPQCH